MDPAVCFRTYVDATDTLLHLPSAAVSGVVLEQAEAILHHVTIVAPGAEAPAARIVALAQMHEGAAVIEQDPKLLSLRQPHLMCPGIFTVTGALYRGQ